jgi:hypothetical protein
MRSTGTLVAHSAMQHGIVVQVFELLVKGQLSSCEL